MFESFLRSALRGQVGDLSGGARSVETSPLARPIAKSSGVTRGLLLLLSVSLGGLTACGDESTNADSGVSPDATADAGVPSDAGPMDATAPATLQLRRAFTTDGTSIKVQLSAPPAAASVVPAAFAVEHQDGSAAGATISAAELIAGTSTVTLTLAAALPKTATYRVVASSVVGADGSVIDPAHASAAIKTTLSLAMIWHQHQPLYVEPNGDYLRGPWVRKHAVKDYYDMAATVGKYPDIHVMVNLTPVLLYQLQRYYLDRLEPYVDTAAGTIDVEGYFSQRPEGVTTPVTDPWIDLLLQPTPTPEELSPEQRGWFYTDIWSDFSISDVMLGRFPVYQALRTKKDTAPATLTQYDLLAMKIYFQLAWFDPDFLRGPVTLPSGDVVDLSDVVTEDGQGKFRVNGTLSEALGQRLVVEEYKVLANVVAIHRELMYDAEAKTGQIEVMTTPFFHPILPLLVDTDLTKVAMPTSPLPSHRLQVPEDARDHVAKAKKLFSDQFGKPVTGMWPAEGSVAEAVVPLFQEAGVRWIATDRRVLEKSTPADQPIYTPYRIDSDTVVGDGGDTNDELAIVFRDTELSDKLGFFYQGGTASANVVDFLASLEKHMPSWGEEHLLTVILDGENAWEHYALDNDAKGFLNGIYAALTAAQRAGVYRTVTVSEYLDGNPARGVTAHPTHGLPELEPLWAGSWISGNFSTWIGEDEENLAWDYLSTVRADLAAFEEQGLTRPDPDAEVPEVGTPEYYAYQAWQSMYAAEGSDWFWWYGSDQTAAGGDGPFDRIYIETLKNVYRNAALAGIETAVPDLAPILRTCTPPRGPLTGTPTVDGVFVPDDGRNANVANEWTNAGAGVCMDVDSGVTANPNDVISTYYWGLSTDSVWLALRMNAPLGAWLGQDYQVRLYFSQKHIVALDPPTVEQDPKMTTTRFGSPLALLAQGAAREVVLDFSGGQTVTASTATVEGSAWGTPAASPTISVSAGTDVIEVRIPYAAIHFQNGDPLEVVAVATHAGEELDRLPNLNSLVFATDRTQLVEVKFVLDATGSRLALEAVKPIANPPPPRGTGKAFIVGSLDSLANWAPNTIQMYDDGTHGDDVAGDNFWTYEISVPPLTEVNYKYTIGDAGQTWGPTEEYPLTNRGFEVKDLNGDLKMELHDVFADRPDPSGTLPAMTVIANP